jgi:hypothetical protein
MTIDYFRLGHPLTRFRSEFALHARKSMFDLFMDKLTPGPESKVLDLGVTPDRSLAEPNLFEALYPWKHKVVAASIENARWLPQPAHQALLRRLGLEFWAKTENLNLLTPRSFRALFPACGNLNVYTYRLLGLPSNIVVYGFK